MKKINRKFLNVFNRIDLANLKILQLCKERDFDDDLKAKMYSIIKDIDQIKNALSTKPKAHWLSLAKKMSDEFKKDSSITRFLINIDLEKTDKHIICSIEHSIFDHVKNKDNEKK